MSETNDKLKSFIVKHGRKELSKPEGEWREIMSRVENESRSRFRFLNPKWLLAPIAALCLALALTHSFKKEPPGDLADFLADTDQYFNDDLESDFEDEYLALIED
jgi:hypothetical protein